MAIKKSFADVAKGREQKTYFNSEYGLSKKANLGVGVEVYLLLLGLDTGIYETPKHNVKQRKVGSTSKGFRGNYDTSIVCKGYDVEGNRVEGAVCCQLAQEEKDRLPDKNDSSKRMISFTNNVVHIPALILGNSETDPKKKQIPPTKLSIKTYDFTYLELAQSTFQKVFVEELATKLKNDGMIDYELEGDELQAEVLSQLKNTIVKITGIASDKGFAYEKSYSFIPFTMSAIGKNTDEYTAITNYTENKPVMNDVIDFLQLFDTKVDDLVVNDWTDEELLKYVKEDTKRAENVAASAKNFEETKKEEIVSIKEAEELEDNIDELSSNLVDEDLESLLTEEDILMDDGLFEDEE